MNSDLVRFDKIVGRDKVSVLKIIGYQLKFDSNDEIKLCLATCFFNSAIVVFDETLSRVATTPFPRAFKISS